MLLGVLTLYTTPIFFLNSTICFILGYENAALRSCSRGMAAPLHPPCLFLSCSILITTPHNIPFATVLSIYYQNSTRNRSLPDVKTLVPTEGRPLPGILPQSVPSASSANASANEQMATPRVDGWDRPSGEPSGQPRTRTQARRPYHYSFLAEKLEQNRPWPPGSSLPPSNGTEQAPIPPGMGVNSREYRKEPPLLRRLEAHRRAGRDIYKIYRSSGLLRQDVLDRFVGRVPPPPPPSSGSRLNAIVMATARTPSSIPAPTKFKAGPHQARLNRRIQSCLSRDHKYWAGIQTSGI